MEEEIKLLIVIILTFCTLIKMKSTWRTTDRKHSQLKNEVELRNQTGEIDCDEQTMNNKFDDEAFIKYDQILFPPTKNIPNKALKKCKGWNQSAYQKAITSQASNSFDTNVIYNNGYFQKSIFDTERNRIILSNEEHIRLIEHKLMENETTQSCGMSIQNEQPNIQSTNQAIIPKKKTIAKAKRLGKKASRSRAPSKNQFNMRLDNSLFDIDKQIQKREEQIRLLKRMKNQRFTQIF